MTIQCNKVLRGLRRLTNKSETPFLPSYYKDSFSLINDADSIYECPQFKSEFDTILKSLEENGYIEQAYGNFYSLTQKGLHPYQITFENVIHIFFTSILCPIIVAFITSLITLAIFG